jgi:hypothetical protein
VSYSTTAEEFWVHFNYNHELGQNAIPLFVMICPNLDDPAHSEVIQSYIGSGDIVNVFNNTWQNEKDDCIESLPSAVEDIRALESITLQPNPASDYINIEFSLSEPSDIALEVLDLSGKSILRRSVRTFAAGENMETLDVSEFASGTYFVRLTQQNAVNTMKFTVAN